VADLEKALIVPERDAAIIEMWRRKCENSPTIAFCCSHKHAIRVADSFNKNGIPARAYLSSTSRDKRLQYAKRLALGSLKALCVVDVLNEGADMPFVECLLFLRPTESKRIFHQQLGRGLRRYVGKSHCTVVDFIGNFKNAYQIVEYQGLLPIPDEEVAVNFKRAQTRKEILNLPLGCEVHFDGRVVDIFAQQTLDPRNATRHNIGRILLYRYERLCRQLGRRATRRDVDRYSVLHAGFFESVFGSWARFQQLIADRIDTFPILG
jgi:superfamily II DNA or RNA helicase